MIRTSTLAALCCAALIAIRQPGAPDVTITIELRV
jgi:hypothetical protein